MSIQFGKFNPEINPLSILGSLAWWVRADQGITIATGVSQWNDLSGNARHFTQGTAGSQPIFISSAINGQPAVQGDGVNDALHLTSWTRAAPGTQPFYIWIITKQVTYTLNDSICGDFSGANGCIVIQSSSSPTCAMYNGAVANSNNGGSATDYVRMEMQFTNSISDYIKIRSTSVGGANSGNLTVGSSNRFQLFCRGDDSTRWGNVEIAEAFFYLGTPTTQQRLDLDAYCTARYGAGLI